MLVRGAVVLCHVGRALLVGTWDGRKVEVGDAFFDIDGAWGVVVEIDLPMEGTAPCSGIWVCSGATTGELVGGRSTDGTSLAGAVVENFGTRVDGGLLCVCVSM